MIKAIIQENKGVSPLATQVGRDWKESTGKYIAFVDADDKVSATYIKDVLESIKDDSCDFVISSLGITRIRRSVILMFSRDRAAGMGLCVQVGLHKRRAI